MRVARLILLGVVCYLLAMIVLFPAAPVIDRIRPQLGPVALEGVSGPLWRGRIASVRSTDDLLPLEFENVGWRLAPSTLPGGGGAHVAFEGYEGEGQGLLSRSWNNDVTVSDFTMSARAKALEPLLPVPLAEFDGQIRADIERLAIESGLLAAFNGRITWSEATLSRPFEASFGTVQIDVAPEGEALHAGSVAVSGGDVDGGGRFTLAPNGDFTVDVSLTPTASAPTGLVEGLQSMASPNASGTYRLQQNGNVNRL